jgi:hypothetical protein
MAKARPETRSEAISKAISSKAISKALSSKAIAKAVWIRKAIPKAVWITSRRVPKKARVNQLGFTG